MGRTRGSATPWRRAGAALAASLGLHGLLLISALRPAGPPSRTGTALEVTLAPTRAPPRAPAAASPEATRPQAPAGSATTSRPRVAQGPAPRDGAAAYGQGVLEAAGLVGAGATPGGPDLGVRRPAGAPGPAGTGGAEEEPGARVERVLRELAGRVRAGSSFDARWAPLARQLRDGFHPSWNVLDHGPRAGAARSIPLLRVLPGYLDLAGRYGRAAPLTDAEGVLGERRSEAGKVVERLVVAGGTRGSYERGQNPFEVELRALVEIAHAPDGAVERVAVRESSGNAALDRAALETARSALEASGWRPPPGSCRTSVWAFVTRFGVIPPVPAIACPPEVLWTGRFDRCAYPLKKYTQSSVELHAIE